MTPGAAASLAVAAFVAGAINLIAGGGSLVSFPVALAIGLPPLVANATNTVAMTPASLASAWAYRHELRSVRPFLARLALPSFLGGAAGSALLLATPARIFDTVVPVLVCGATALLFVQNTRGPTAPRALQRAPLLAMAFQLAVSVYGGYFGAGMGIMMLAAFALLGVGDIHQMNALKSVLGGLINGTATAYFLLRGTVDAQAALLMGVFATVGGFVGAVAAKRVPATWVRWTVIGVGMVLTIILAAQRWA